MSIKRKFSEEHRRKLSESRKRWKISEDTRKKMSELRKGKSHSEETKQRISEAKKGKPRLEETKRKLSEINKGKRHSEEAKKKMSESRTGDKNHFYGKQHSEETKRKISELQKGKNIGEKNPNWTGGKVEIICKGCGKKRKTTRAKIKKEGNFCSRRCNSIWNIKHSKRKDTSIEIAIEKELLKRNIPYMKQVPLLGICLVDFLLPNRIILQCDGDYWHNRPNIKTKDINQDFVLEFNNYKVYRFTETEINKSTSKCIDKISPQLAINLLKIWKGQGDQ